MALKSETQRFEIEILLLALEIPADPECDFQGLVQIAGFVCKASQLQLEFFLVRFKFGGLFSRSLGIFMLPCTILLNTSIQL